MSASDDWRDFNQGRTTRVPELGESGHIKDHVDIAVAVNRHETYLHRHSGALIVVWVWLFLLTIAAVAGVLVAVAS